MSRRRRGKRKGGKSKSIAIGPILPVAVLGWDAYTAAGGLNKNLPSSLMYVFTGLPKDGPWVSAQASKAVGMVIAGLIAHKVANKTVNKHIRKLTMGYLSI